MKTFTAELPKIELHAHLNGSLKETSILELGEYVYGANTPTLQEWKQKFLPFNFSSLEDCLQTFQCLHLLTATKDGLSLATQFIIRDFVADNVIYLELRTTPKSNESMTQLEYLTSVIETILNVKDVKDKRIIVKLLASIDRSQTIEHAMQTVDLVHELRSKNKEYENLLTGIDLSGNPRSKQFQDFVPVLEKARNYGLKLALHCAEIENAEEISAMIEFGMERCGHGTFLTTAQIAELNKRKIAIECCLTSNVKCGTVPNYADHHFKRIFEHRSDDDAEQHNENLVICTDDCGVFDTDLSQELSIAAETFQLSKENLRNLQLNAVKHAFASDEEKKYLRECILNFYKSKEI